MKPRAERLNYGLKLKRASKESYKILVISQDKWCQSINM